jgi:hypothetical protein
MVVSTLHGSIDNIILYLRQICSEVCQFLKLLHNDSGEEIQASLHINLKYKTSKYQIVRKQARNNQRVTVKL